MLAVTRLRDLLSAPLDYLWPVATTVAAVIGSDRLNRWLRPDDECYEPEVVG